MSQVMTYFPFKKPLNSQVEVIQAVEKAFQDFKYVILESPVGSGKSPMAITLARYFGNAHVMTPRKGLQDQYYQDFNEHIVLMKGRASYPCTIDEEEDVYNQIVSEIQSGSIREPSIDEPNCKLAPCRTSRATLIRCTEDGNKPCPFQEAVSTANLSPIIVHNLHSFIYQTAFAKSFDHRRFMVIDECHEVEGVLRGFVTTSVSVPGRVEDIDYDEMQDPSQWIEFFTQPDYMPKREEDLEKYREALSKLDFLQKGRFIQDHEYCPVLKRTKFTFIPDTVGKVGNELIFKYADKILLMSGTIYDKKYYCELVGINPDEATFLRVGSNFPVSMRPIIMKEEYMVDTSYKSWADNKRKLGDIINKAFDIFSDVKGLIQVPSYWASEDIKGVVKDKDRLVIHDKSNFSDTIKEFFNEDSNSVFVSPICQQGVDFKDDRARFQLILRVPYLNTSDKFVEFKVKNDFRWYNYQALVTFGQQIGRVNRNPEDFGVTILVDSRFPKFIKKNRKILPKWLLDAIQES